MNTNHNNKDFFYNIQKDCNTNILESLKFIFYLDYILQLENFQDFKNRLNLKIIINNLFQLLNNIGPEYLDLSTTFAAYNSYNIFKNAGTINLDSLQIKANEYNNLKVINNLFYY